MEEIQYIDYGIGNKKSVVNALCYLDKKVKFVNKVELLNVHQPMILPGVGSFLHCQSELSKFGFFEPLKEMLRNNQIRRFLGICVGMQMLFEKGNEDGESNGLSIFNGQVEFLGSFVSSTKTEIITPHISWCDILNTLSHENIGKYYFIHSFGNVGTRNQVAYYKWHNQQITAIARKNGVWGVQFHPEKSGEFGLQLMDNILSKEPEDVI